MKHNKTKSSVFSATTAGFTLVEIAIVLVIIGVILGAMLKGQELVQNAKVKRVISQEKETLAAILAYTDRYGLQPGDDKAKTNHGWTTTDGDADGTVKTLTTNCAAGSTAESCLVWQHLRLANLISGDAASTAAPTNAYGGTIGFGALDTATTNVPVGHWLTFVNIPYDVAQSIDTQMDDGVYNSGSVRSSAAYTSGSVTLYFRY